MRVTNAGSCATILCSAAAVLFGSSTVLMILAVISGKVAIVVTFLIDCCTNSCGSIVVVGSEDIPFLPVSLYRSIDTRGMRLNRQSAFVAVCRPAAWMIGPAQYVGR